MLKVDGQRIALTEKAMSDREIVAQRRVPCLVAYLHPFRMIESEALHEWKVSIEEINKTMWDHVPLHEIAGGIDVGLPDPYHLVVARDGALALPPIDELRSHQKAVDFYNRCLAGLMIGGVYCEAITTEGLEFGSLIDWKYVRSGCEGRAAPNRFHRGVRYRQASAFEAIGLLEPPVVSLSKLSESMALGLSVLREVPSVRGEYLLKGVTGLAHRDWGAALSNLWIITEQVVSELWEKHVVQPTRQLDSSKSRRDQLDDTRTWTASARVELLFQKGLLENDLFKAISLARKARNELAHRGQPPDEADASSAYSAVRGLLSLAVRAEQLPFMQVDVLDHSLRDPFKPQDRRVPNPKFWMPIPKLPGEEELEKAEARIRAEGNSQLNAD